jgi:predicted MFS family arabinose efflux permease
LITAGLFIITITVAEMIAMPFMNSYYISRSSDNNRGQYAGMYTMAWSVAQVIGSSFGALIAYKLGFSNLWLIVCSMCAIAAGGYYWMQQKK